MCFQTASCLFGISAGAAVRYGPFVVSFFRLVVFRYIYHFFSISLMFTELYL
nr:MAG TPA: hypothetical protein [Caudoviricetes sp.]